MDEPLEDIAITHSRHWQDGPPHDLFKRLRSECPVQWSEFDEYPGEEGSWGLTKAADVRAVSLDWETFSSYRGGVTGLTHEFPLELMRAMFIAMDPPKHDRIKQLFQRGFTPKRIGMHTEEIRAITAGVLEGVADRGGCDLVADVAQPVVSRVIGSFMGIPPGDDDAWAALMNTTLGLGDTDLSPGGREQLISTDLPEVFERCLKMVAERRQNPTDDLTSVLVNAEIDGETLDEHEIVMGFFLLVAEPSLIPSAVEESLRMFPAFAHFRRTATRDTEIRGQEIREGEKVMMWYVSSNRDEDVYGDPDRFDVRRNPDHQAFGAGGRHFCLGAALARLELRILLEETLVRLPQIRLEGEPTYAVSPFINQLKTLPVRWD